ncbi:efflux RND transporter permease subunit, partial [Selenomonas sp.]|uniref:efflux RND transporter permease subunit n=1 Tax=Selenomonas sp. TaxID=2053611 RepID=UPI0025F9B913
LTHKKSVLVGTVALFAVSVFSLKFVKQEFFPASLRPEIIVDLQLPEGSSMAATQGVADRMNAFLAEHADELDNYSYYVGGNAPRFVLPLDPKADADNITQFVLVAKDTETREKLAGELRTAFADEFGDVRAKLRYIQTGPMYDYPVMLRVTGLTVDETRALAAEVADIVAADPNNTDVNLDWNEKQKTMHLALDQDKLRAMGLTSQAVSQTIYTELTGATGAQFYAGDRTIDIDLRLAKADRSDLGKMEELPIYLGQAGYVPLGQIAKITYEAEDGLIKRYNLRPAITVQANIKSGTANDATQKAYDATKELRDQLPLGARIDAAGTLDDSDTSMKWLMIPIPAMVFLIMTLLMFQLRSGKDMALTLLTAPLGIIGVTWGMLLFNKAMGFVAILGVLALTGMIIRNSVILIDQIQKHLADGESPWDAVVDSAVLRFRPIMLTAAAAILGMVPLMTSAFWGPMAVAIASGLFVATVLTLLVLPTMYAAVYGVKKE